MSARLNRGSAREIITVPPHGEPHSVCALWPECECQADCIAGGERRRAQWAFLGLVGFTAAIGAGLILWSYFL
ncbi:hypothetical protein [Mesorhizobium sp.]|uniref:hypothetical protein n=1 Tax=Mesorhizobium sp. TaxID=1871066 RepID=UPI000FE6B120|nr:hypothetical protein [Mesorhizobium sp.]RWK12504.1 MAG: hypothetical protein EOR39_02580 [Mesorhizobium sp.]